MGQSIIYWGSCISNFGMCNAEVLDTFQNVASNFECGRTSLHVLFLLRNFNNFLIFKIGNCKWINFFAFEMEISE